MSDQPAPPIDPQAQACRLAKDLCNREPVILDTETTGLGPDARIVDICLLDISGNILYYSLINPEIPIPPEASAVHGITGEMVKDAITWPDAFRTIAELTSCVPTLSYNADFDSRMIAQMNSFYHQGYSIEPKWSCIMELYAQYAGEWDDYHGHYRWHKLANAAHQLNLLIDANLHRAAADADLARQVLLVLAARADLELHERDLKAHVERLADARAILQDAEMELIARREQLEETPEFIALREQESTVARLNILARDAYNDLCSRQVDIYGALRMNVLKPVTTRTAFKPFYETHAALQWAKTNLPDAIYPETLDRSLFERHAKAVMKTAPLDFVHFIPTYSAIVASDLSEYCTPKPKDPAAVEQSEIPFV